MFDALIADQRLAPVVLGADINEKNCECFGIGLIGDQPCPFHFEMETPQAEARRLAKIQADAEIPENELPF
jgi:hypothetical protein